MNSYEFSDADNSSRSAAYVARIKMYYLRCTQFLTAIKNVSIQKQISDLAVSHASNPFLGGTIWDIKLQRSILSQRIRSAERLAKNLSVLALDCGELIPKDYPPKTWSHDFILSFVENPEKAEFYEEELRLDYYGKAEVKFFDIEKRWQATR